MESESKNEVEEVLKTPEVDQESLAVETNDQSTNGNNLELTNDSYDYERRKSAASGSHLDDSFSKNAKTVEVELSHHDMEPNNKLSSSCAEEPKKLMDTPEWANTSCSEQTNFMCFCHAGVPEAVAITKINEVRQELGIPEIAEQFGGTESTEELSIKVNSKDSQKVAGIDKESTSDLSSTIDVTNKTAVVCAPSSADIVIISSAEDESDDESSNPNSSEYNQIATSDKDGVNSKSKWVHHPDCKNTLEELKKMALQIQSKRLRERFVYKTYCRGVDTNEQLKIFLEVEAKKPRIELRKMSKILPKKLRAEFYCKSMKRNNPHGLMRKYLSMPQNQQWLLCKRLNLSDTKLLFKVFQQPGQKSNNPVSRPLKEWFNIFLQEGSVDEAVGKVKSLILRGSVAKENVSGQIAPNDVASAEQSCGDNGQYNAEITSCRQFGKKSKTKRNKKFQQLNEDQMKVYNTWVEQGLSHQDALTIVLRFPGERRPTTRMNVCAWGKCDKHPQQKPRKTGANANGTHPSVVSESNQLKKPIFDRIPVPSIVVDTSSPPVAGLSLEHQTSVPSGINSGTSITPLTPHVSAMQSEIPPSVKPSPTLAIGSQGPRVPQKSTFVDKSEPLKPAGHSKQDPSSADTLRLCIVPPGYPRECFSDSEFKAIENSIHIAISGISDERMKPIFKKQFRNNDKYEMVCQDQLAKKWLHKYVACMYPVVPLKIIPVEPTKMKARAVLPLCKNDATNKILSFLARQNEGLNVSQWEVVERSESGDNTSLQLFIDEESVKVLKNCSEVGFKMGIANINVEDSNQLSSKASSGKSGARQALSASGSTARGASQADKHTSTSNSVVQNLEKEQLQIPANKQRHESREPGKNFGPHSKMPSGKDLPETVGQNFQEPYKPRYVGRRHSHEYRDSREQHDSGPMGYTIPSSLKQNAPEPNVGMRLRSSGYTPGCFKPPDSTLVTEPWYNTTFNAPGIGPQDYGRPPRFAHPPRMPQRFFHPPGMPPRFPHPPCMLPRFAHPPGMPPRFAHPPGMPPRFAYPPGNPPRFAHPPGMPPRYAHPLDMSPRYSPPLGMPLMYAESGLPPSNGFFLERPKQLEQINEENAPRSPSPDFDELLKSARSRLNLPDEPTDASKSSSSDHPKQVRSKHPAHDVPSIKRTASEHLKEVCSTHPTHEATSVKHTASEHLKQVRSKHPAHEAPSVKRTSSEHPKEVRSMRPTREAPSNKHTASEQPKQVRSKHPAHEAQSVKCTASEHPKQVRSKHPSHEAPSVKRTSSEHPAQVRSKHPAHEAPSVKRTASEHPKQVRSKHPAHEAPSIKRTASEHPKQIHSKYPANEAPSVKRTASEHPQQLCSKHPAHEAPSVKRTADRPTNRNEPPKRIPVSGGSIKRNHSPQRSSYLSRSRHRKRSYSSPPPARSTKSSRWN